MTCGFFILSVPCLSKLIVESGLPRHVKTLLGFGPRSGSLSEEAEALEPAGEQQHHFQGSGCFNSYQMKPWLNGDMTWSRIGEGDADHHHTPG